MTRPRTSPSTESCIRIWVAVPDRVMAAPTRKVPSRPTQKIWVAHTMTIPKTPSSIDPNAIRVVPRELPRNAIHTPAIIAPAPATAAKVANPSTPARKTPSARPGRSSRNGLMPIAAPISRMSAGPMAGWRAAYRMPSAVSANILPRRWLDSVRNNRIRYMQRTNTA